jgi:glycine/D-amino acid oxidase-like deaminating enzyme/nitrite reductase/ring-hydroxylating ferredoxin subunit
MTQSPWMEYRVPDFTEPLRADTEVDVCVVGAGIAGLSTAYQLARAGSSVLVLDAGRIGGGQTGLTTAHLSNALDDRYFQLERVHGEPMARLAAESHAAAIDCIEAICIEEGIECDFARVDGYLFAGRGVSPDDLDREFDAAARAGVAVERLGESCVSWYDTGPCLRFARQAEFHPLRYLAGLARAAVGYGCRIHTGVHVSGVHGGEPCVVTTDGGVTVRAGSVVMATNTPVHTRVAMHTKQSPWRTYVIGIEIPAGVVPHALYWDMEDPYHYVRVAPAPGSRDRELLVVGGADHRTGQEHHPETRWDELGGWTRERFPMAGPVAYRWSGQILEPIDGIAYIGASPSNHPHVFLVTGDSGNGLTHGTLAGILLRDLIEGRPNPWTELYQPARLRMRALPEYARGALKMTAPYAAWMKRGEVSDVAEIDPGQGALVRRGLKIHAAYRDVGGDVHEMSAVCTHLGGVVQWNSSEGTWDCPCHGSRFSALGEVLNGPAIEGLAALDADAPTSRPAPDASRRPDESASRRSPPPSAPSRLFRK